ncbi:MAG: YjbE family putative metal transport protein [Rhodospirillales bacterium]|nr:YjbE family putative metal transport protein [Rhodospirillales bacterium]
MLDFISMSELSALGTVIVIDLVLAGDNAIVVGMVAASLPREQRPKVIAIGIVAATLLRIVFTGSVTVLLQIIGLLLAGGILLLWVAWKLWRDIEAERRNRRAQHRAAADGAAEAQAGDAAAPATEHKSFRAAVTQVIIADVTMSLDNILGVAGAAREHFWVLVVGLVLSVAFMGMAATAIARLLERYHWIAYVGTAVIAYVAMVMVWEGAIEVTNAVGAAD